MPGWKTGVTDVRPVVNALSKHRNNDRNKKPLKLNNPRGSVEIGETKIGKAAVAETKAQLPSKISNRAKTVSSGPIAAFGAIRIGDAAVGG